MLETNSEIAVPGADRVLLRAGAGLVTLLERSPLICNDAELCTLFILSHRGNLARLFRNRFFRDCLLDYRLAFIPLALYNCLRKDDFTPDCVLELAARFFSGQHCRNPWYESYGIIASLLAAANIGEKDLREEIEKIAVRIPNGQESLLQFRFHFENPEKYIRSTRLHLKGKRGVDRVFGMDRTEITVVNSLVAMRKIDIMPTWPWKNRPPLSLVHAFLKLSR